MEEKLIIEFTQNKKFLRQYYSLRKIIYNIDLGIEIAEYRDYFDSISDTIIARKKQKCIGGARITVCNPMSNAMLPSENDDFRLKYLLPELNLEYSTYAEYSRLVLLPEYRDNKVSERMYKMLNRRAKQLGVRYVFVIANRLHARLYMRSYRKLGFTVKLLNNIYIPDHVNQKYNGVADCMIMLDMAPKHQMPFIERKENLSELVML